jgi:hypothetical protein
MSLNGFAAVATLEGTSASRQAGFVLVVTRLGGELRLKQEHATQARKNEEQTACLKAGPCLTPKGTEAGGEFRGSKFGAYFLWPEAFRP